MFSSVPTCSYLCFSLADYSGRCFDAERCTLRPLGATWTIDDTCEMATCIQAPNGTLMEKRNRYATDAARNCW